MARFMVKASEYKNVCKAVNDRKLAELKKEIIEILKKQDEKEFKKAVDLFESQEMHYSHLEKSITGKWVEKAGYGVGTVRIWKGKKYKKIAPGKWARVFDKEGRGTNIAIGKLIAKVQKIDNVEDLMDFVMQNKQRFVDENGEDLPILNKLRAASDIRNEKLSGESSSYTYGVGEDTSRAKNEIFAGKDKITKEEADLHKVARKFSQMPTGELNKRKAQLERWIDNKTRSKRDRLNNTIWRKKYQEELDAINDVLDKRNGKKNEKMVVSGDEIAISLDELTATKGGTKNIGGVKVSYTPENGYRVTHKAPTGTEITTGYDTLEEAYNNIMHKINRIKNGEIPAISETEKPAEKKENDYVQKKRDAKEGYWSDEFKERNMNNIKQRIATMREDGASDKKIKAYLEETIETNSNDIPWRERAIEEGRVNGNRANDYRDTIQERTVRIENCKELLKEYESESEKTQNRSDAMKGNKNAEKGGEDTEDKEQQRINMQLQLLELNKNRQDNNKNIKKLNSKLAELKQKKAEDESRGNSVEKYDKEIKDTQKEIDNLLDDNYSIENKGTKIAKELNAMEKDGVKKSMFDDFVIDMFIDDEIEDEEELKEGETEYNDYSAEQPGLFNSTEFAVREALNRRFNCL